MMLVEAPAVGFMLAMLRETVPSVLATAPVAPSFESANRHAALAEHWPVLEPEFAAAPKPEKCVETSARARRGSATASAAPGQSYAGLHAARCGRSTTQLQFARTKCR